MFFFFQSWYHRKGFVCVDVTLNVHFVLGSVLYLHLSTSLLQLTNEVRILLFIRHSTTGPMQGTCTCIHNRVCRVLSIMYVTVLCAEAKLDCIVLNLKLLLLYMYNHGVYIRTDNTIHTI